MSDNSNHAAGTKAGAGEPPHEGWRNRDYGESDNSAPSGNRRWLQIVAAVLSAVMGIGLLWGGVIEPLLK